MRKGEVIAEIDPRDYELQYKATEAEYKQIKSEACLLYTSWGKDGILPEYLMLVSGLFHNSVAYWQR